MNVTEIAFKCGCKFGIHKNSAVVKLCKKHYPHNHDLTFDTILKAQLRMIPPTVWEKQK